MLENTSEEFRERFILMLTKEIIENTNYYKSFKNKEEGKGFLPENQFQNPQSPPSTVDIEKHAAAMKEMQKGEIKEAIKGRIKEETEKMSEMQKEGLVSELDKISRRVQRPFRIPQGSFFARGFRKPFVNIQEPALPETVSYVKPIPTSEQIDLARLNILVRDPLVKVIECVGPSENIYVSGIMGRKKTPIKLSKEEIDETMKRFSETAKIPLTEGLFKAAVGSLVISAVISEVVGTQFVIRKISGEF